MANAIGARHDGDDYQSRLFWLRVCDLFDSSTKVVRVAFEEQGTKAFDDVVVYYGDEMLDEDRNALVADHFQVKFHRWHNGAVTWDSLMSPDFINASQISLLQRLHAAQQKHAPDGTGRRFILCTPWGIDPVDDLAQCLSLEDERMHPFILKGGPRSRAGQRRAQLMDHLSLKDDAELATTLQPFRLQRGPSLPELDRRLNERLYAVGLVPGEAGRQVHPYDDLTRRLVRQRPQGFTRNDIEAICKAEKLWRVQHPVEAGATRIGIRSFQRATERLEQETDAYLCLLPHFNGRFAHSPETWQRVIYPEVKQFLGRLERGQRYHLFLYAHTSIAFAAGYCLDSKAGVDVVPIQPSTTGTHIWRPALQFAANAYPGFVLAERLLHAEGNDVAIVISVVKDIFSDVEEYVGTSLPRVRRVITFTLPQGTGSTAVIDGTHAYRLAHQVGQYCKEQRAQAERQGRLHFFISAPNGLVFFLGQQSRGFGTCLLYEYDFEHNLPGDYHHTLAFPPLPLVTVQGEERIA